MSAIGPLIDREMDDIEEHGFFVLFNDNPGWGTYYIRVMVWRRPYHPTTIVGHDFEFATVHHGEFHPQEWGISLEKVAQALPSGFHGRALADAAKFIADNYNRLKSGSLALDAIIP